MLTLMPATTLTPETQGMTPRPGKDPWECQIESAADGYTIDRRNHYDVLVFPEIAQTRHYTFSDLERGIVVEIMGHRYRLHLSVPYAGDGIPEAFPISFEETTDDLTPCTLWDAEAARLSMIARLEERLDIITKNGWDEGEWIREELDRLTSGECTVRCTGDVVLFGQPDWVQSPMYPAFEGRAAYHLMTLNTEWGDCGNINIMVGLDAEGRPARLWFEASCA